MRLNTLSLERFGPFIGQTLPFRADAKLHVVYGRNEAGKSCALAALTDLLFGIERQTKYDFLHQGRELRIGAVIADRTGQQLKFRRRKGNKNTLLSFDTDTLLPDDVLVPYLGSITRDVFCNAFGLNAQTLRSGAEEMLKSEGEVGATLFAAASGLRGLTELRQQLDAESNSIFASRASKERTFYQSLERFTVAGRAIRERELRAGQWKELNDKIERLDSELNSIKQKRQRNASEHARLSRLRRVAPQIALIDVDLHNLADLGPLPDVEAGFAENLEISLKSHDDALRAFNGAVQEEQQARSNYASLTFDEAPLTRANDIVQLFSELGGYTRAQADVPTVERQLQGFADQLVELAARLGLPDAQAMEHARPSDATLALIGALVTEGNTIFTSISTNDSDLLQEQDILEQVEEEAGSRGKAIDPKPFSNRFAALAPALRQFDRHNDLSASVTKLARQLEETCSRLKPALPTSLDTLAATQLPLPDTIARIGKTLEVIDKDRDRLKEREAETNATILALEQRLTSFATDRPVPTREAVVSQRTRRDAIWHGLRSILLGEADGISAAMLPLRTSEFERSTADADRLSDEALIDASRVAEFASAERQLTEALRTRGEIQQKIRDLDVRRNDERSAYSKLWADAGLLAPLPPAEMTAWLESVNKLLDRREELQDARDKLSAVQDAVQTAVPSLLQLATEIGLDDQGGHDPAALTLGFETRLREMTESWSQRRELEAKLRAAKERVTKLFRQKETLAEKHRDWLRRWEPAVAAISVRGATIEQAQAALTVWHTVPSAIRERDDRAGRISGMRADMVAFAKKISALVVDVAPDLASLPSEDALKRLNERLSESTKASTRHAEAGKRLEEAVHERKQSEIVRSRAQAQLGQFMSRLPSDADPLDLCRGLRTRDTLRLSIQTQRNQLVTIADGTSEDELRLQITGFDPDFARGTLANLELESAQLDQSANEAFAAHRQALADRDVLEQGIGAEHAAVQKRSAEAELLSSAREWSVLKLGSLLLGATIERQRANQQDPLMLRAGQIFSTITGNSFSGLGQEFDNEDVPRLIGRRPDGADVQVGAMSEGARDQLYLALRLAYLEDYAKRSEPIPFVGDDLFMTFDDDRTKNGLMALADLSRYVQPILFTHHKHVVELARQALGDDVDVMELDSTARSGCKAAESSVVSV